jgi:sarcosine oxidase
MSASSYDVIVIGVGGMGSATCYELARRGQKVLGLERFDIGHSMGSSHGETRMLRLGYFEGQSYVPMVLRAHQLWQETGKRIGEDLLTVTGTLDVIEPGLDIVERGEAACQNYDLPYEILDAQTIMQRYPAFHLPRDYRGLFQPGGGYVKSDKAILAYTALAIDAGAVIHPRERVLSFELTASGGVKVVTEAGSYEAGRLVLSPGPWINAFVPSLKPVTQPYRQVFGWFRPLEPELFRQGTFPCFTLKIPEGHYYGFPLYGHPGFKLGGPHHGREACDPETLIRENRPSDEKGMRDCLQTYLPAAMGTALQIKVCIYTMTPDEDFIIDTMPDAPQIVIASPCSGHGFKFASVMGEILADLAMDRTPAFDLSPFRMARFNALS